MDSNEERTAWQKMKTMLAYAVVTVAVFIVVLVGLSLSPLGAPEREREDRVDTTLDSLEVYLKDTGKTRDAQLEAILDIVCDLAADRPGQLPTECVGQ